MKYIHRVITPSCMLLYALEILPDRINVCDVSAINALAHDTHTDVLRTCGTPYPCSDHLCTVPDGFWVCLISAMAHFQISFCPGNCRKKYGILINILFFFSMVENIMPFPSNSPLPEEVCFLSEEQETALCGHAHVCVSLIVPSQVLRYLCHHSVQESLLSQISQLCG